ncbi:MAG: FAD-dependent monooxygenase [Pseudomonadota bacterium]
MKAIVCGGSIGGLFCAAALRTAGWDVTVVERSPVEISGRGAGIVTHPALIDALERVGAGTKDLGVAIEGRAAIDQAGSLVDMLPHKQIVTSWDRVRELLRVIVPEGGYELDRTLSRYHDTGDSVAAQFEDGTVMEGDILVGADGFRSAVRGQMLPDVSPRYAGYVAWRALAEESALSQDFREHLFGTFSLYAPSGMQVLGYPIAGAANDLTPGRRHYNFGWYAAYDEATLADMLTDETGTHHDVSIPPPLIRASVLAQMERAAQERLPTPLLEVLKVGERPFFTPIYDYCSPTFAAGRVALAGDAACLARPHVGMGVTKAAGDALALADALTAGPVEQALAAYSDVRVPVARTAYERAQMLGRYVFSEASGGAANPDGRNHPHLRDVLTLTAVDCSDAAAPT